MKNKHLLIKSIKIQLEKNIKLPHQACSIAYDLFLLSYSLKAKGDDIDLLTKEFIENLPAWGMTDLLDTQVKYAMRLAESNFELEYEEMHKLFSLCDEIFALEFLGLHFDKSLKSDFEKLIKNRFELEKRKANMVAKDKVEDWQQSFWWYQEA